MSKCENNKREQVEKKENAPPSQRSKTILGAVVSAVSLLAVFIFTGGKSRGA